MTKVFLVDDHEIVRRGLSDLLVSEPGIEISGEAASVSEALSRILAKLGIQRRTQAAVLATELKQQDRSRLFGDR